MVDDLKERLRSHQAWVQSIGKDGNMLELEECDLREYSFDGLDLTEASLCGSDLAGASFVGANLYRASLDECCLEGANFTSSELVKASIDSSSARGCNFSGALILRTSFIESDLRGANFSGAKLVDPHFGLADIRDCDLTGADVDQFYVSRTRCSLGIFDGVEGTIYGGPIFFEDEEFPTSLDEAFVRWQGRNAMTVLSRPLSE